MQQLLEGPNGRHQAPDFVKNCDLKLQELEKKLEGKLNPGNGGKIVSRFGFRALKWPFEREEVDSIIQSIKQYGDMLSNSLNFGQTYVMCSGLQLFGLTLTISAIAKGAAFNAQADEHDA